MIKKEEIEALIKEEVYWTTHTPGPFGSDGQVMICVLKTHHGYECLGHSGTITPRENWDGTKAKEIARANAFNDLWAKEAYFRQRQLYIRNTPTVKRKDLWQSPHTPGDVIP